MPGAPPRFHPTSMARCTSLSEPYNGQLSKRLIAWIASGMLFMLLPGTFLGVMNLLKISAEHEPSAADAGWIQAHGHAQIFGWIGSFIMGIGFYAIPRLRLSENPVGAAWTAWGIWTAGVGLRLAAGITEWQWRVLLPVAGALELIAASIFFSTVFLARTRGPQKTWRGSLLMIEGGAIGMLAVLAANLAESIVLARAGASPVFPPEFDSRFLSGVTWGFIVPFIWGFSTRWIPPLLGLRPTRKAMLLPALGVLMTGAALASPATILAASIAFVIALRIFEPSERKPKLRGVHPSVKFFLRSGFAWMIIAALLGIAAERLGGGFTGASRHALTVGFMVVTVFSIGSRVLPAFFGVRRLFSTRLMFAALLLITAGCALRVGSEVLAYGGIVRSAWQWLPPSAILEMTAIVLFAFNMVMSLTTGTPYDTYIEEMSGVARQARGEADA